MKKETRRIKMTKDLLCDSLIHFLKQKDIQRITVKEICEFADINRSTFYRYYQDPFDQLMKLQQEIILETNQYVAKIIDRMNHLETENSNSCLTSIEEYLDYMQSKKDLIQLLVKILPDNQFWINFVGQAQNQIISSAHSMNTSTNNFDFIFASSGCIGLLVHWLTENPDMSSHEMAELMSSYTSSFCK